MIIKIPMYIEFNEKLTPDQLADFSGLVRRELFIFLKKEKVIHSSLTFEGKKIPFDFISLQQVEERMIPKG
jgi:hypothetical protein